jgi:uncharacterized protein YifN (PemK superfamily)
MSILRYKNFNIGDLVYYKINMKNTREVDKIKIGTIIDIKNTKSKTFQPITVMWAKSQSIEDVMAMYLFKVFSSQDIS